MQLVTDRELRASRDPHLSPLLVDKALLPCLAGSPRTGSIGVPLVQVATFIVQDQLEPISIQNRLQIKTIYHSQGDPQGLEYVVATTMT